MPITSEFDSHWEPYSSSFVLNQTILTPYPWQPVRRPQLFVNLNLVVTKETQMPITSDFDSHWEPYSSSFVLNQTILTPYPWQPVRRPQLFVNLNLVVTKETQMPITSEFDSHWEPYSSSFVLNQTILTPYPWQPVRRPQLFVNLNLVVTKETQMPITSEFDSHWSLTVLALY